MLLYFPAFFYGLLYLAGMELIAWKGEWAPFLAGLLLFFALRASREIGKSFAIAAVPLLFVLSSVLLLYLIDSSSQRQLFLAVSTVAYYVSLMAGYRLRSAENRTARSMLAFSTTLTLFFFYSSTYGFYLNFNIPLWALMLAYCVGTFLASYPSLRTLRKDSAPVARMYGLVLSLAMAEFAWIINFWPFGYLTTGVTVLIFYYVLWDLTQSYFLNILSQKRVFAHIIGLGLLTAMILASSRWFPTV
jgi:hypothetical protein